MTTIIIPKQPVNFEYCNLCDCLGKHCVTKQIAQFNDKFSFQLQDTLIFTGEELMVNGSDEYIGDFEDGTAIGGGNWQNSADGDANWVLNSSSPLAGSYDAHVQLESNILFNTDALSTISTGDTVRLSVLHSAFESGCDLEIYYYAGGGAILLTTLSGAQSQGTFIYNFIAAANITGFGFKYTSGCTGEPFRAIDNISVRVYDFSGFKIFDCCTSEQKAVLDSTKFTITDSYITFEDLWSNYVSVDGIYKICIDDIDLILNGNFIFDLSNWSQTSTGTTWVHSAAETAAMNLASGATSKELYQEINLPSKCSFQLTFEADVSITSDITISVYINHEEYETYSFSAPTLNQTVTITSKKPITSIGFLYQNNNVASIVCDVDKVTLVTDICSRCFDLTTTHECSYLLESTNSHDAFGFEFDGSFTLYQRLYSDLYEFIPEYEQVNSRSSSGVNSQVFGDLITSFNFKIYQIPDYLMKAVLIMIIMNTVYIDGVLYVKKEGAVELDWDRRREFVSGVIEMLLSEENNQNTYS